MARTLALLVLVPFTALSTVIAVRHGALGFLEVAGREPWGLQILLDLSIALFMVASWIVRDARQRGVAAWPWILATVALGSIGPLAYVVTRRTRPAA